jgi:ribonuclease D
LSGSSAAYIADAAALRELCVRLRECERFALDTEFVGDDSFIPRLEIIQVAMDDFAAVIDFQAVGPMDCLADVLGDARIEKVLHAGRQDLELFHTYAGRVTSPVFDTQVAAAMVGYGTQIAYGQLVARVLGPKLAKSHTLTNWSQRPLTPEQLRYAIEDVQYLLPLHRHLSQRLHSLGRSEWVQEEFRQLESRLSDGSRDPRTRYLRIKGWENLKPRSAAVLRELAAWRDEEARRRNVPRGRIIRDDILLELARRAPSTLQALKATRGLHPSEAERSGETLLALIKRGLAVPESEWPESAAPPRPVPDAPGLVDVLQAVLKVKAQEEEIAPSLLATASDLLLLVDAVRNGGEADLPILRGWRRKLAGETLLKVLTGQILIGVDPRSGKIRLTAKQ